MRHTDLHNAVDDIPTGLLGIKLLNGKLQNFYGTDLEQLMNRHDVGPVKTKVRNMAMLRRANNLPKPILNLLIRIEDYGLRRTMKKYDCNFALLQAGDFFACYDFYKI